MLSDADSSRAPVGSCGSGREVGRRGCCGGPRSPLRRGRARQAAHPRGLGAGDRICRSRWAGRARGGRRAPRRPDRRAAPRRAAEVSPARSTAGSVPAGRLAEASRAARGGRWAAPCRAAVGEAAQTATASHRAAVTPRRAGRSGSARGRAVPARAGRSALARGRAVPTRSGRSAPARGRAVPSQAGRSPPAPGRAVQARAGRSASARGRAVPARAGRSAPARGRAVPTRGGRSAPARGRAFNPGPGGSRRLVDRRLRLDRGPIVGGRIRVWCRGCRRWELSPACGLRGRRLLARDRRALFDAPAAHAARGARPGARWGERSELDTTAEERLGVGWGTRRGTATARPRR